MTRVPWPAPTRAIFPSQRTEPAKATNPRGPIVAAAVAGDVHGDVHRDDRAMRNVRVEDHDAPAIVRAVARANPSWDYARLAAVTGLPQWYIVLVVTSSSRRR